MLLPFLPCVLKYSVHCCCALQRIKYGLFEAHPASAVLHSVCAVRSACKLVTCTRAGEVYEVARDRCHEYRVFLPRVVKLHQPKSLLVSCARMYIDHELNSSCRNPRTLPFRYTRLIVILSLCVPKLSHGLVHGPEAYAGLNFVRGGTLRQVENQKTCPSTTLWFFRIFARSVFDVRDKMCANEVMHT